MAGKLTDELWAEIVRRYAAGQGSTEIAAGGLIGKTAVLRCVTLAGIKRSRSEARKLWSFEQTKEVRSITTDRWREMYWGDEKPSVCELARRFGVGVHSIRLILKQRGIKLRSFGEQYRIDVRMGRRSPVGHSVKNRKNLILGSSSADWTPERRARCAISRRKERPPREGICHWCAAPVHREYPSQLKRRAYCSKSHAQCYRRHKQHSGDAPRPLILAKLRERLGLEPYKALPFTYDTCEKAGAGIGAGENEIVALLFEGTNR